MSEHVAGERLWPGDLVCLGEDGKLYRVKDPPATCCPVPATFTISATDWLSSCVSGDYLKAGPAYDLLRRCREAIDTEVGWCGSQTVRDRYQKLVAEIDEFLKTPEMLAAVEKARGR